MNQLCRLTIIFKYSEKLKNIQRFEILADFHKYSKTLKTTNASKK